ncbi:hypothetical protein [Chryseobacterium pennipullorum]|uniref:Uncharacterized protein n=1 Tax=Chryseobacterium pennipullorum TaxID=2258963 RepID=A0A3D9B655_9FLAO|nr:hypothetical protein [Chryseobacterium pennipullorum]REC49115.1 hypothetical protein DRF67_06070 [Chryseobacterium pennipullorum]
MENLNQTSQEVVQDTLPYTEGPIGNKLDLIDGVEITPISQKLAESFMATAKTGSLSFLKDHQVNFNRDGKYEVSRSMLDNMCQMMKDIKATYLTFNFVQIDPKDSRIKLNPYSEGKMIYMVASLQTSDKETIDGNNYLIMNADLNLSIKDLKISDQSLKDLSKLYRDHGHKVLTKYSNKENTICISYHIVDLINTLSKDPCEKFKVNLCEITDVQNVVSDTSRLRWDRYRRFFETREKQMTLVFTTDTGYYDMGSLYP